MKYSIRKSKERKSRRIVLEKKIAELESLISTNSSDQLINEYNRHKADLETIYNYITSGIILRSKTNWYEYGEKSTKYF